MSDLLFQFLSCGSVFKFLLQNHLGKIGSYLEQMEEQLIFKVEGETITPIELMSILTEMFEVWLSLDEILIFAR